MEEGLQERKKITFEVTLFGKRMAAIALKCEVRTPELFPPTFAHTLLHPFIQLAITLQNALYNIAVQQLEIGVKDASVFDFRQSVFDLSNQRQIRIQKISVRLNAPKKLFEGTGKKIQVQIWRKGYISSLRDLKCSFAKCTQENYFLEKNFKTSVCQKANLWG